MKNTIQTLENLHSDYVSKFDPKPDRFKRYLSQYSLKCYHRMNRNGNKIYRYSICHGVASETQEMTRAQMINALKNAIDNNKPLLRLGAVSC